MGVFFILSQWLPKRVGLEWRRMLVNYFHAKYLSVTNVYTMNHLKTDVDNIDQRIATDVKQFSSSMKSSDFLDNIFGYGGLLGTLINLIVAIAVGNLSFTLISYVVGNTIFSQYLQIQYIPDVGEISIFCGSIVGACLGFLWYNAPPAKIFMGDTGSLSLGGSLAAVAIIVKHEIVLAIIGGLFVLETVSVIIQVISFKLTGKRIFKMAPIHHHFEKKGWAEPTIVIRFWIIAIILALVGLATLKLR